MLYTTRLQPYIDSPSKYHNISLKILAKQLMLKDNLVELRGIDLHKIFKAHFSVSNDHLFYSLEPYVLGSIYDLHPY